MGFRDLLHHELARGLNLHHEDPVVQKLAGLRRIGGVVYSLGEEVDSREGDLRSQGMDPEAVRARLARARAFLAGAQVLVAFADSFVLDGFVDENHPNHVPHVTFLQAQSFYQRVPAVVTAVRQELEFQNGASLELPVLPGPRFEVPGRCPVEHLLAMKRAASKVESIIGTRIEALKLKLKDGTDAIKGPLLRMQEARTQRDAADLVIGAIQEGQRVDPDTHEQAESYYYDGVLRPYLYAAQELEVPGCAAKAPETENDEEEDATAQAAPPAWSARSWNQPGAFGGIGFGQLFAADMMANLAGDLLGGLFGGGNGNWW
jgi:hypothetical protein